MANISGSEFEIHDPNNTLTPRQGQVLVWVVEGKENESISTLLGITLGTVKFHMVRLLRRFDAPNRQLLISRAFKAGLVRAKQLILCLMIASTATPGAGDQPFPVRITRTARARTTKRRDTDEHPIIELTNLADLQAGDREAA